MIDAPWWAVLLALVFAAILAFALFVVFMSTFGLPLSAGHGVDRVALSVGVSVRVISGIPRRLERAEGSRRSGCDRRGGP